MAKLFNQYYTKKFDLPGRFTAMNGAIQYFELTAKVALTADAPADPENPTVEEAKAIAEAQANYLRVLEVLRSRGAQPIITHVDDKKLGFTLEQTWVYGSRDEAHMQVSSKDLKPEAVADITSAFDGVKALVAKGDKIEEIYVEDKEGEGSELFDSVEVKTTIGSLDSND